MLSQLQSLGPSQVSINKSIDILQDKHKVNDASGCPHRPLPQTDCNFDGLCPHARF